MILYSCGRCNRILWLWYGNQKNVYFDSYKLGLISVSCYYSSKKKWNSNLPRIEKPPNPTSKNEEKSCKEVFGKYCENKNNGSIDSASSLKISLIEEEMQNLSNEGKKENDHLYRKDSSFVHSSSLSSVEISTCPSSILSDLSSSTTEMNTSGVSKRQLFRSTPIHSFVMDLLDKYELGIRSHTQKEIKKSSMKKKNSLNQLFSKEKGSLYDVNEVIPPFDESNKISEWKIVKDPTEIPTTTLPEIAFIGRSNVGKSSLLNKLSGHKVQLSKVSDIPGQTKALHFYRFGNSCIWNDMPGYGFAFGRDEKVSKYPDLIQSYLKNRSNLRKLYLLLDARHGLKRIDQIFIDFLERYSIKFQVVLTKCDLVPPRDLARRYTLTASDLLKRKYANNEILMVSVYRPLSIEAFRKHLLNLNILKKGSRQKDLNYNSNNNDELKNDIFLTHSKINFQKKNEKESNKLEPLDLIGKESLRKGREDLHSNKKKMNHEKSFSSRIGKRQHQRLDTYLDPLLKRDEHDSKHKRNVPIKYRNKMK